MNNQIILCLGDNSSADAWAHKLSQKYALENKIIFRGAITNSKQDLEPGCFHTGPHNIDVIDIIKISKNVDKVVLLDQNQDQYSHPVIFVSMFKLLQHLKAEDIQVVELNTTNMETIRYWDNILNTNKSFCAMPWIYHGGYGGYHTLCFLSHKPIKKIGSIKDWQQDKEYNVIRSKMLQGEPNVDHCKTCYHRESKKELSVRLNDSLKWLTELKVKNLDALKKINNPVYYEIRPSNKCNIKCRTCEPKYSHLIEEETKKITDERLKKIFMQKEWDKMTDFPEQIGHIKRIYVAGGEPTVQPKLYKFLRKCIDEGNTDFDFRINTNSVKISEPLFDLFKHFPNLGFSCSIDGVPKINDYIRWGTDTSTVVKNIHRLHINHQISFISVISIYNVTTIGELMKFFDTEFPYATVQLQTAGYKDNLLDCENHPNHDKIIKSLKLAKQTKCYYHNERGTKSIVDRLYQYYSDRPKTDLVRLSNFFKYNDTLDNFRNSKLEQYIPDLEACRSHTAQRISVLETADSNK